MNEQLIGEVQELIRQAAPKPQMPSARPLDYAGRCERYARQAGWHYDPARLSFDHLTAAQRRRALKKEWHQDRRLQVSRERRDP